MERITPLPVLLLVMALALAGCAGAAADDADDAVGPDRSVSSGAPTDAPSDGAGATQLTLPAPRVVHDGVQDAAPRPFERVRADETDDSLHVIYWTGVEPCAVLDDIEVEATTEAVTITLQEGYLADEDGQVPACIEIAEEVSVRIPFDDPLAGRALIDGATGEPVPVDVITMSDAAAN